MKKILISFLFLLGACEIIWPVVAAARWRDSWGLLDRAFDYAKFTGQQQQAFQQLFDIASDNWNMMSIFGLTTIVAAVLLLKYK